MSKLTFDKFIAQMQAGKVFLGSPAMGSQYMWYLTPEQLLKGTAYANILKPKSVERILRKHVEAGADVVYANTFSADKEQIIQNEFTDAYRVALDMARSVAPDCLVIAPLGTPDCVPLVHYLAESHSPKEGKLREDILATYPKIESSVVKGLVEGCREKMQLSIENGAEAIQFNTFTWARMTECVYAAYETLDNKVPLLISFHLDDERKQLKTGGGSNIDGLFDMFSDASVIGYNCAHPGKILVGIGFSHKREIKPLMAFPSPGLRGRSGYKITLPDFAGYISNIIKAGARLVGACCGSNSQYTQAMRGVIDTYNEVHGF